ncbi:hypothetical protein [Synechococcus sp. Nb3U1]|uniref:hypothetical protein n=1 Tax=Synechococcus sp. Nb3U1 TaxID=1914529 RepID=UPI001F3A6C0F|nr:hypothetical protein [Synechococcus sp. Nb3U1]
MVGGRCCGDEIRRGDRTTVITKSDGVQEIMRRDLMIIFHTVRAYDRDIDVISPGMTAGIIVPDTLAEEMRLNWVLEGECHD